jgi:hypothetical protein
VESSNCVQSLLTGLLMVSISVACEANATEIEARGKVILQEKCGRCHAVEAALESPLKNAPTMRDIYVRYVPRELQKSSCREWSPSTRPCRRSSFRRRKSLRLWRISMRFLLKSDLIGHWEGAPACHDLMDTDVFSHVSSAGFHLSPAIGIEHIGTQDVVELVSYRLATSCSRRRSRLNSSSLRR